MSNIDHQDNPTEGITSSMIHFKNENGKTDTAVFSDSEKTTSKDVGCSRYIFISFVTKL